MLYGLKYRFAGSIVFVFAILGACSKPSSGPSTNPSAAGPSAASVLAKGYVAAATPFQAGNAKKIPVRIILSKKETLTVLLHSSDRNVINIPPDYRIEVPSTGISAIHWFETGEPVKDHETIEISAITEDTKLKLKSLKVQVYSQEGLKKSTYDKLDGQSGAVIGSVSIVNPVIAGQDATAYIDILDAINTYPISVVLSFSNPAVVARDQTESVSSDNPLEFGIPIEVGAAGLECNITALSGEDWLVTDGIQTDVQVIPPPE